MSDFENSSLGKLAKLLDEGGFQVTITGWKAELEACEAKLKIAMTALREIDGSCDCGLSHPNTNCCIEETGIPGIARDALKELKNYRPNRKQSNV